MRNVAYPCAVAALFLFSTMASANESWQGAYVGGFAALNSSVTTIEDVGCWGSCSGANVKAINPAGGIAIGYDAEPSEGLVVGLVADISTGHSKSYSPRDISGFSNAGTTYWRSKVDWQSTARLRLGLKQGKSLIYLTGGGAIAKATYAMEARDMPVYIPTHSPNYEGRWKGYNSGVVYGVGIEHRIGKVGLSAELLHFDYTIKGACVANSDGPAADQCFPESPAQPAVLRFGNSSNALRIGANLRF